MPERKSARWRKFVGYPAFFLVALLVFVHLTLPYGELKAWAVERARRQGYALHVVSVGPSLLFGISAEGVTVAPLPATPHAKPRPGLHLESVTARPGLLPPGLHLSAKAFGGEVDAFLAGAGKSNLRIEASGSGLELAQTGIKPLVGVDLRGEIGGKVSLLVRRDNAANFTHWQGQVQLHGQKVVLKGGTVGYVDLPAADLDQINLKLKLDKGKATIDTFKVRGGDLEGQAQGKILLASRINYFTLRGVKVRFKPKAAWLKKYSFISTGLNVAGHPDSTGHYTAVLDGMLLHPQTHMQ